MIGDIKEIGGYGLNIIITESCNLKCPYCFQKEHPKKFMSLDTFKNIIDSADDNCNKNIILFGGEPTLNKDFIKMAIYAHNYGYNISIITNGHLINNINEWGPYFNSIVFSIKFFFQYDCSSFSVICLNQQLLLTFFLKLFLCKCFNQYSLM